MKYLAEITVTLKDGIRDPQGTAVETVLQRTNIDNDATVKVGKFFKLFINAENQNEAEEKISKICSDILANPVMESYEIKRFEQL